MKILKRLSWILVLAMSLVSTSAWTPSSGATTVHSSGIEVLGPAAAAILVEPNLRKAWTDALHLAEIGDGLGYPWADAATGTLVLSVANPAGQQLANQWITSGATHTNPKVGTLARPSVPVKIRSVSLSFAALEGVKLDATRLVVAGLPDADAIYEAAPDWENNRIELTLSRNSDALINALAARYGTSAVAVRIAPRPDTKPLTRTQDFNPFYGGAIINTGFEGCSSGFSWADGFGTQYMLTAAHCAPNGSSNVTTTDANFNFVDSMGTITSGSRENWTQFTGTVLFSGDSTYRGDVALVEMFSGKSGGAFIYSGAMPDQTSASTVHEMWTTVPTSGEQYCTGGSNTYAICGWTVNTVRTNYQYLGGEWGLNVTKGLKSSGTSGNNGDSGGPVYTVNGTGTIAAKGIISGGTFGPSSCTVISQCVQIFTDILLPYFYFPGVLKTL